MHVTPENLRELNNSRIRGEKGDDLMSIYILSLYSGWVTGRNGSGQIE